MNKRRKLTQRTIGAITGIVPILSKKGGTNKRRLGSKGALSRARIRGNYSLVDTRKSKKR